MCFPNFEYYVFGCRMPTAGTVLPSRACWMVCEVLHLDLPFGSIPPGLDLSSSHPRLRTLRLSADRVVGSAIHFLRRHPSIEHLSVEHSGGLVLGDGDLPKLKVLCVDQMTLLQTTHLRLNRMPYLTTQSHFGLSRVFLPHFVTSSLSGRSTVFAKAFPLLAICSVVFPI